MLRSVSLALFVTHCVASAQADVSPLGSQGAPPQNVIVLELFTSQGCSACPKANAELLALSRRPDVIALSYSVDYWDYLGWKDTMARPEFSARQRAYLDQFGLSGPYTPQLVLNGRDECAASRRADLVRAMDRAKGTPAAKRLVVKPLAPTTTSVSTNNATGPSTPALRYTATLPEGSKDSKVWLAAFEPGEVTLTPRSGLNRNKTMVVANPVMQLRPLTAERSTVSFTCPQTACAVMVQDAEGRVLAAGVTPIQVAAS